MSVRARSVLQKLGRSPRRVATFVIVVAVVLGCMGLATAALTGAPKHLTTLVAWGAAVVVWVSLSSLLLVYLAVQLISAKVRQATETVVDNSQSNRAKQSRHEYQQELALAGLQSSMSVVRGSVELEAPLGGSPVAAPWSGGKTGAAKVLFVTSNGSGMGHIARCLAISRAAEARGMSTAIVTLSTAYKLVRESGRHVLYYPSPDVTVWRRDVWNRRFAAYLYELFGESRPDVVVFDGTAVYRGLTDACRQIGVPLVWMRREMWKDGVDRTQFDAPFTVADYVLVPGDVGSEADPRQDEAEYLESIVSVRRDRVLSPQEARSALGLDPNRRYALIQTGKATIEGESVVPRAVEHVRSLTELIEPVVFVSPVAPADRGVPGPTAITGRFPLAPYLQAFDFAVCSAGYNSVHENLELGIPAVYVPQTGTLTDDQVERARRVEERGLGLLATDFDLLASGIAQLCRDETRGSISKRLAARETSDGSSAAAEAIAQVAEAHGHERDLIESSLVSPNAS
jgi:hypothetical protein